MSKVAQDIDSNVTKYDYSELMIEVHCKGLIFSTLNISGRCTKPSKDKYPPEQRKRNKNQV